MAKRVREPSLPDGELARLAFHGAAGEVTGSCFLLRTRAARVLFECGMFQGGRDEERRNRRPFPFDPRTLDAAVLTHAHVDHSGLLPKLVRDGFRGAVHATAPTRDLLGVLLRDSAHIHELEARRATRRALRRGRRPVEPLTTVEDAERALERVEDAPLLEWVDVAAGVRVRFRRAGHILGSASVEVRVREGTVERSIAISGDVGRAVEPLLRDPDPPEEADLALLESTYGDRDHRDVAATLDELAEILADPACGRGNTIVPVFAVGRAQEVLYRIAELERAGRIPARPVYLDSPMAIRVSELYLRHAACFEQEVLAALRAGELPLEPRRLALCRTPEESMALNGQSGAIVLAGSGMCEAGRVVHHLKHNLWRPESRVLMVGFQARGTTGRALVDGARRVRVLGEPIAVRARVHTLGGFSAHAGQSELAAWAEGLRSSGAAFALVHGEPEKRAALAELLRARGARDVREPGPGDEVALLSRGGRVAWPERPGPQPRARSRRSRTAGHSSRTIE